MIDNKRKGWLLGDKNKKLLVQIGREFFSLRHEFTIKGTEDEIMKDLKEILKKEDIRLLEEK